MRQLPGPGRRLNWILVGRLSILGALTAIGIALLGSREVGFAYGLTAAVAIVTTILTRRGFAGHKPLLSTRALPVIDSLLLGVIVHFAGGVDGPFSIFFFIHALYAGNVLGARGGFYCALLDTLILAVSGQLALMGFTAQSGGQLFEYFNREAPTGLTYSYLGLRLFLHACLLISAGLISGFLSERLKSQSGRLLEALDALRTTNARSRDILESLPSGILVIAGSGEPLSANGTARNMLGLGEDWQGDLRKSEIHASISRLTAAGAFPQMVDFVVGQRIIACQAGAFEQSSSERPGMLFVLTDVTELRNLQSQLEEREKLAVIGRLSATMAHEIRNPLASISGAAQVIRSGCSSEAWEKMIGLIVGQAKRASDIIEGYLELARGGSRQAPPEDVRLDLIVHEAVENARRGYAHGVEVRVGPLHPAVVTGRESRLMQMVENLLRNACEALEGRAGGAVKVELDVDGREDALLRVSDNGPGISPEILAKATEPFYSTREYGTGLGLYVVRKVVEEHRGTLSLLNLKDGGLEITIRLPVSEDAVEAAGR